MSTILITRSIYFLILTTLLQGTNLAAFSLMLAPAGDARLAGRTIRDQFERGIALPFVQHVAQKIHQGLPAITIAFSHAPGESVAPLQQANFSNRLNIDLYVSMHCYQEEKTKPCLSIFQFGDGSLLTPKQPVLSFVPVDQAHTMHSKQTTSAISLFYQSLNTAEYQKKFCLIGPLIIPFKPLIGVVAPAIGIELGITHNMAWQEYADIIATQLSALIKTML